jgi:serpin B
MNGINQLVFFCMLACSTVIAPFSYSETIFNPKMDPLLFWTQCSKHFTTTFYSHAKHDGHTFVFSPISLQLSLAMTAELTFGATHHEIIEKGVLPEDETFRRLGAQHILDHLNEGEKNKTDSSLILANGAWLSSDIQFSHSLSSLGQFYQTELHQVNFRLFPEETVEEINTWVNEKTKYQIQNLISKETIDQQTKLVLVNTLFMRAPWAHPFNPEMTYDAPFYGIEKSLRTIPYMRKIATLGLLEEADYTVVELPFKNESSREDSLCLFVVLPREGTSLEELEEKMTTRRLDHWISNTEPRALDLSLPKFKISSCMNAKKILKEMGLQRPFSTEAEFGIKEQRERLIITDIVHNTVFEVDEFGATGSAGTAIAIGVTCYREPAEVIINRPFLVFVADKASGIILFAGRVMQPST